ncbi:MAG TPA: hypothetical protein VK647_14480 [Gemmatimonadales bacterium]|jgi:hypothetical protein|nr:hypothetical protein [Gemmatimonadales bacterium]
MRTTCLFAAAALWLAGVSSAHAQRRIRLGPTYSSLGLEDLSGSSHSFSSFGGSAALITGDDAESGITIARYNDLSTDGRVRRLTLFGLDSYYYPVGARGVVAPFAGTTLGLARVSEARPGCLLLCGDTVSTSSQLALAFGLGVRLNVGSAAVATLEGRFLQVPGSDIQALEAVANASVALGSLHKGALLAGTLGPVVSAFIPISGPLRGRSPFAGVRFRRETKKAGSLGLQIDYAPLEVTAGSCAPGCRPNAILFAPGYEASVRPAWGRVYGEIGLLLAGFYAQGPDRGMAQGAHGGIGADFYSGRVMWNVNGRLLWLQRNSGQNVFGVQVGVSLSPRIGGSPRSH